ncbi:CACTA transposable element [Tanacetum coccineum]
MFICNAVMTIDKSWTTISNRNSEEFLDGLFAFIKHCKPLLHPITQKIHCPCSRCCNRDDNRVTLEILEVHISRYGFDQHYTTWKYHGEPILPLPPPVPHSPEHVDMDTFFEDISANNVLTPPTQTTGPQPSQTTGPNNEFEELLSRSTQKLYPGCDMSTLEFTTEISHIKALHKITDAGFNKILALLQKACPPSKGYNFPSSYYEIKKTYKKIGLGYESIHACINDCFLFWGSEENLKMPNCPVCKESRYKKKTKAGKLVAKKIVRYFPLTPRLQRMFNTKHIAKWMTWHATGQSKEKGKMNHPCDGRAWKYFDMMKPEFSGDARNVRLGLAADGFNPFGMMSQTYSMWPVILTTYNTPPWMCMKETSLMLTMLIPGPKSPAKDIDVYLQPLIKELQELWKGVWTKDAATGTHFQMKAALLWTINDFPARSSLSGWSGQGYYACPTCNVDTPSMAVKNKIAYVGNAEDDDVAHVLDDDDDVVVSDDDEVNPSTNVEEMACVFPRSHGGDAGGSPPRRPNRPVPAQCESSNLRIETGNASLRRAFRQNDQRPLTIGFDYGDLGTFHPTGDYASMLNSLMGETVRYLPERPTKDTVKARQTWKLWKVQRSCDGIYRGCGYSYGVQQYLPKSIAAPIIEFCLFFKQLCARTLMQQDMSEAKKQSISILIELQQIFPPAFFNIMIHVAIHLPDEAILGGPIRYRWMFPFERYMKKLKNYVRNKAKPEGSITEGYVAEEALTFCSRYLKDDVETRFNRLGRNDDGLPEEEPNKFQVFRSACKLTGRMKATRLTTDVRQAVVWFVLNNSPEVDADILAYREKSPDNVETNFPAWFNHKFVVHERDILHTTQCSGVSTLGLDGEMYYGQLEEILELTYIGNHLARQPRGWKVVEHVYHRDVVESDQYVIHGSSSSNVTLSVELTNFEHTDLSINSESTEVDAPPVNDDNANANEGNAEDDDVAHVLDDDDDVVVSDDDEVNPNGGVFPRSYGGMPWQESSAAEERVVGDRTEDDVRNNLVDWWSHPDRVARSLQNAANRAKNTILTHQGKKSFAQGRNEYLDMKEHARSMLERRHPVQEQIKYILLIVPRQPPEHVGKGPGVTAWCDTSQARSSGHFQMLKVGRSWIGY